MKINRLCSYWQEFFAVRAKQRVTIKGSKKRKKKKRKHKYLYIARELEILEHIRMTGRLIVIALVTVHKELK